MKLVTTFAAVAFTVAASSAFHLSARERADLQRDLAFANRDIYWQEHDRQTR